MFTFEVIHRFLDDLLKCYLERGWRDYQRLDPSIRDDLLIANKHVLFACNAEARIDFAHIALQALEDFAIAQLEPHHFVTYTPADAVIPIEQAAGYDISVLQQRLRQAMPDIPFIGMVEAAIYKGWGRHGPTPRHDHVSWHVHLIPWRATREQLEVALEPLKSRMPNMYDRPAIWIRDLLPDQIERVLLYMLKGQVKEYRVNQTPGTSFDPATGEVRYCTRQQKKWIETGNHVRMCTVLKHRWLPDLFFGKGDGSWLVRAIRFRAMQPFCRWAEDENRRAQTFGRELPYPQVQRNRALGQQLAREIETIRSVFPHAKI